MIKHIALGLLLSSGGLLIASRAEAAVFSSYHFNGTGNWSMNTVTSSNGMVNTITADVPLGSTVEKAFLYSTTNESVDEYTPTVTLEGITYTGDDWTNLGMVNGSLLTTFITDVTSQVATLVGGGSEDVFTFALSDYASENMISNYLLSVVYSNPNESEQNITFLASDIQPPEAAPSVPEPTSTVGLILLGILGLSPSIKKQIKDKVSL
ncbi:hypothetical protein [Crocosphaera sp. Alani8]|uniref:hypothetical protein n=1 Tax=Crocosphaera sp. Alani8 TaxID=3038952 RepID=UPI00313DA1C8